MIIPEEVSCVRSGCPSVSVHHAATWLLVIFCFFSRAAQQGEEQLLVYLYCCTWYWHAIRIIRKAVSWLTICTTRYFEV